MDAPTPLDALAAALRAVDSAADACLALAWATSVPPDERRAAARRAVNTYEATDRRANTMLAVIIADGGTRGLDDVLGAAHRRAVERLTACYALRAGCDGPGGSRAVTIAEHAADAALARLCRAQVVALAWLARKAAA